MFKKLILKTYKDLFGSRCDDPGYIKYLTYKDFPSMKEEKIEFESMSTTIRGGLYYNKESLDDYSRIIIFCHGMGGGYLSYMTEINILVNNGFLVLAYDYTGTFSSSGENLIGFSIPLKNLESAYNYIKTTDSLKNKKISIMGHSWGGFTALNSLNLFDDITHVVALSAPLSFKAINKENFKILNPIIYPSILKHEYELFGDIAKVDGLNVINSNSKLLSVYSKDDNTVNDKYNYLPLRKRDHNKNHSMIIMSDRNHNPTYTKSAVEKLNELFSRIKKYKSENKTPTEIKELLKDIEWEKVVEQDMDVWNKIIVFLNS